MEQLAVTGTFPYGIPSLTVFGDLLQNAQIYSHLGIWSSVGV